MAIPAVAAVAVGSSGGGVSGKVGHVKDMTASYISDAKNLVEKAVFACGFIVQREAKMLLNETKGERGVHSSPGEVPYLQSGQLRTWISAEGARTGWGEFYVKVGPAPPTDKYGLALEMGTSKMSPRPFLRPAFDNKQKEIQDIIANAVKAASGGGSGVMRDPTTGKFMSGGA